MQYPPSTDRSAASAPRFDGTQACAGADIDLFFPARTGRNILDQAKRICAGCRFQAPCLEYALTAQGVSGVYVDGVWGGTTTLERRALRRGRGHLRHLQAAS